MARTINRLSPRAATALTETGRHADGGGLYLSISPNGGRRWTFLFRWRGKPTEIGFGSARDVPLARAREKATAARAKIAEGIRPQGARHATKGGATFGECADRLIASLSPRWRNPKHLAQWKMTLTHYAAPLRNLSVDAIATGDVLGVVKPIWHSKPETASRLRGRIERVLDAAKAEGLRRGDNPARWRGNLKALLPERDASARKHHAAMAYADLPAFMVRLRDRRATAALALEFTILTAARTNETLGARWPELDLEGATWTIPKERMKAKRAHRVPLSARAVEILAMLYAARAGEFVFPGYKPRRPLSGMSMEMLLRRMGFPPKSVTVHGFRSTFRDWASETTGFPNDVCEMALAHTIKNKAEAAYRRGDLLDKRRELMDAWAAHCMP